MSTVNERSYGIRLQGGLTAALGHGQGSEKFDDSSRM